MRFLQKPVHVIVVITLIVCFLFSSLISFAMEYSADTASKWFSGMLQNLGSEFLGAIVTFLLIEKLVGGSEKEEDYQQRQQHYRARIVRATDPGKIEAILDEMKNDNFSRSRKLTIT